MYVSEKDVIEYKRKQMAYLIVPLFFYYFAYFSFGLFYILLANEEEKLHNKLSDYTWEYDEDWKED